VFMNGYKCKSPISALMEYLNLCQDKTNASMCLGITFKNDDTLVA
jgi:hypothetical protein